MTTLIIVIVILILGLGMARMFMGGKAPSWEDGGNITQDMQEEIEDVPQAEKGKKKESEKSAAKKKGDDTSAYQLPFPPVTMVGRKEEIGKLTGPKAGKLVRLGLIGKSGIGKTTFGTFIARQFIANYPDAQIYINMQCSDGKPLPAAEAMARILTVFFPTQKLPQDKNELEAFYRVTLKGKHILLFLDNIASSNQLNLLLPDKGTSLLIYTSKKAISIPGAQVLKLDVLDSASASTLLVTTTPRLGVWSKEVCKLCRNIPLALVLSASYTGINTKSSPDEYSMFLREERNRLGSKDGAGYEPSLNACLSLNYKSLTSQTSRVLRKLVVFQGSFTAPAEAFMCEDEDGEHLGHLSVLGLVHYEESMDRYFLHDYVRQFLASRVSVSEKASAQKRHAAYYLTVLVSASESYAKGEREVLRGLRLFDLEWENIRAGRTWVGENASKNQDVARLSSSYTESGIDLIRLRRDANECIKWFKSGVEAARILEDADQEKTYLVNLGQEYNNLQEYDSAVEYLDQALPLCKSTSDSATEKSVLAQLGLATMGTGNSTQAIGYMEQYLELARHDEDTPDLSSVLETLGRAYQDSNDPEKAIKYLKEGLEIARKKKELTRQWRILECLGEIHTASEKPQAATEFYEQGLAIAQRMKHTAGQKKILLQLGDAFIKFGEAERALTMYKKCLVLCRETKDIKGAGNILMLLGDTHAHLNENEKSLSFYQKAVDGFKKLKDRKKEGEALWGLSRMHAASGNITQALVQGEAVLQIFESVKHPETENVKEQLVKWGRAPEEQASVEKS
ncbi:hypothetical protein UR09_06475 [Candidatus Nitromaritima sp. SCGC AAA799-A02]|nr:hypothetical protein UR09_06475 [Candidatus Nitromaritima sp. SCGC AAA799-A02]